MHIESGTTKDRRNRVLIMFVATLIFAAWFAYDGFVGYPKDNADLAEKEKPPAHSREDILTQKIGACAFIALALLATVHLVRVLRTRIVLDDDGMRYNSRPTIGWGGMIALDSRLYESKGFVDLVYSTAGGEQRQRLDAYHVGRFEEIIDAICERKGFVNPLPEPDVRGPAVEPEGEDEDAPPIPPASPS
jgi:hypothetical protein